jgi:hypothetical protein
MGSNLGVSHTQTERERERYLIVIRRESPPPSENQKKYMSRGKFHVLLLLMEMERKWPQVYYITFI